MTRWPWQPRALPAECVHCKSHRGSSGNAVTVACGPEDVRIGRFRRCADCLREFYVLDAGGSFPLGGAQVASWHAGSASGPVQVTRPAVEREKAPAGMEDLKIHPSMRR